jgi:hypothetical protein
MIRDQHFADLVSSVIPGLEAKPFGGSLDGLLRPTAGWHRHLRMVR